ncbi:FixH family protein [Amycolatopsis sp., V23-08]|uniref:FixH family protein n=1 Tax=Amycolatopsis heterodermiae TaxID=3110235 RepID=A0ABU5R9R2_9PSEU|nr:FixH family protein [Amycolatopsis sp., V23-08]MEA5362968.1 FixH family protein [Amycolatopsis sp., V23-08]
MTPTRSRRGLAVAIGVTVAVVAVLVAVLWPSPAGPAVLHAASARYAVTATVRNPKPGSTSVDIDVTDPAGRPVSGAAVRVQPVMPQMGHAGPPVAAVPTGGGGYRADGVPLMMAGSWQLLLSVGADHLTLSVPVSN